MYRTIIAALFTAILFLFLPLAFSQQPTASSQPPQTPMSILLNSPEPYQIFQRDGNGRANITISGSYTGSPTAIEASWRGGAYTTITASPSGGVFSGTLSNQAQGQGTLTVRFVNVPADLVNVSYVGVGDVFFVIGQSNAEGNGTANQVYTHATLKAAMFQIGGTAWEELADPTHNVHGSPWPLLTTLFMADQGVPVGYICAAVGGTGLTNGDWKKGGFYYQQALTTLANSGASGIKAMLWHQGEQDVSDNASQASYQTALMQMVDDLQADSPQLAGVKLVAAQIGDRNTAPTAQVDAIRTAITYTWNNDPDIKAGPLTYDIDLNDGDGVHFGTGVDGQYEMQTLANRWWRMLKYHYYNGTQGRAPRFSVASRSGVTVTVTFAGGVSPLVGQTDRTGWKFTGNGAPVPILSAAASGPNKVVLTLASVPTGIGLVSFGSNEDAHGTTFKDSGAYPMPPEPFIDQSTTGAALPDSTSAAYDPRFAFHVDIEDSHGNRLGSGPLTSVTQWQYTARFDRAGTIAFAYAANDPQAAQVSNRRIARAWALLNGVWTEVGAGRVDKIDVAPGADGRVTMAVSGDDLITELRDRGVGKLKVGTGSGTNHAAALSTIGNYAPDNWVFTPADIPDNDYFYARFGGESVLGALVDLANKTQTHFYRGSGRELVFASEFTPSNMRAIRANGDLAAQTCAITSLRQTVDTHDLLTRIYPYGSGQGDVRLTLAATSRSVPPGYALSTTANYIENLDATSTYGLVNFPQIEFKDIGPLSNTNADLQAAANMLFDAALQELTRRSSLADQRTYTLSLSGCSQLLRPLQTIQVTYRDPEQGIEIDEELFILETTWELSGAGLRTSRLVVSTDDRWPDSDQSAAAERAVQGKVYTAHPQINGNAYWENSTLYIGADQVTQVAEFPFVLGNEVVQVQQVLFRYKVTGVLSFTSIISSASTSTPNGGGSTTPAGQGATTFGGGAATSDVTTASPYNHGHWIEFNATAASPGFPVRYDPAAGGTLYVVNGGSGALSGGNTGLTNLNSHTHNTPAHNHTSGNHQHTTPDHAHTFTPQLAVGYGVYRADAAHTYTLADLEYRVNDGSIRNWTSLDTGTLTALSYYEVDITAAVYNSTTFRPLQENNVVEVRRKSGATAVAINNSSGFTTGVSFSTNPTPHGLAVGDQIIVSGTAHHNGSWTVTKVPDSLDFETGQTGDSNLDMGGSFTTTKSAMVLAKLGIRDTIQSVSYG